MSLIFAILAIALPADDPPFPYEIPEWYEAVEKKLREPIDFAVAQPIPLEKALAMLERAGGIRIRVEEGDGKPAKGTVRLARVRELSLENTIRLLAGQAELRVCPVAGGVVLARDPGRHPLPEGVVVQKRLREIAARPAAEKKKREQEKERIARVEKPLQITEVTCAFSGKPLTDVVAFLRQVTGVNIDIDPRIAESNLTLTVQAESRPAKEVLDAAISQLGLGVDYRDGIIFITTLEKSYLGKKAREAREAEIRQVRLHAILDRKVEVDLKGKRLHEVVEPLQKAIGLPVYPGRAAWKSAGRLEESTAGKTLKQLAGLLRDLGIETIVEPDAVFLLAAEGR